jgi:hypothetical protein
VACALIVAPRGVGQPRSACVTCLICCKVETVACQPWATAMQPTARPWGYPLRDECHPVDDGMLPCWRSSKVRYIGYAAAIGFRAKSWR